MSREEVLDRVENAVVDVCAEHDVVSAYLFGSFIRGKEVEGSDVDVAVYFEEYSLRKLLKIGRMISREADIGREIDLRALNTADNEFAFRVISEGKILYEEDKSRRADVEQRIERAYHDMKPYIEDYRTEMMQRM